MIEQEETSETKVFLKKILSALFFAVSSSMITVVNKTVLTVFEFPSYQVLGIGQMAATILVLWICRGFHMVQFPHLSKNVVTSIWPLPILFLGNMIFGLGSTKELSLPMFTALRRISILMTMILEVIILKLRPSYSVQASVLGMVLGAMIASADDVTFSLVGYVLVLLNDVFSAANGVYMKKILDTKDLGKYGLLYYDSFFMIIPALVIAGGCGDLSKMAVYRDWNEPLFAIHFFISCVMGLVLSYSMMLCTEYNGALTTTIVGSLKNIFVTYIGMVVGGDYVFTWLNFIGLNVSVVASLVYTYVTFKTPSEPAYTPIKNEKEDLV